jgi:phosphatidylserine decarboxylase
METEAAFSSADITADERLPLETMVPQLTTIQPGGGVIINWEQAWGRVRRCWLKTFRRGYVARMAALRKGDENPCPHEVLDPRDLKFHRNQIGWHWDAKDDPFTGRDNLPFARDGLAELIVFSVFFFGTAALVGWLTSAYATSAIFLWIGRLLVTTLAIIGSLIVWFFRDPNRTIPQDVGTVVSPADGKVVAIDDIEHDEFLDGPAVRIGIFLSIFSVHINRSPIDARVIGLRYQPGKCLNALRPESARENERLDARIEGNAAPHRRMIVSQITGAIARRIVCWVKPGDELGRGDRFGMIKLGSRTELVLPREDGLEIAVNIGDMIHAGNSVMARYAVKES